MEMGNRNAGMVSIPQELLLKWLDFNDGGQIKAITLSSSKLSQIDILIEHPDMPEVSECSICKDVYPVYITHQDAFGNKVTLRDRNVKIL